MKMINTISWLQFFRTLVIAFGIYYLVLLVYYRKELLQWWKERKK